MSVISRPALKKSIRAFRAPSDLRAVALLALDLALFAAAMTFTVIAEHVALKLCGGALVGLAIARLFIIGHDACHQCFVSNRDWNRRIGWLAFLPSLTTYSLWEAGHNLGHHVYTNLRGRDYVWTPMSKADFDALSPFGRAMERFYRSGFGYGAYYLVELWWKKLFFPSATEMPGRRPVHRRDSFIVGMFAAMWVAALAVAAQLLGQSILIMIVMAFIWPLALWSLIMGAVIYFHHTHPDLAWYDDANLWESKRDGVSTTMHITFPARLGWMLNNIMTHPVHHLDVRIPLYRVEAAQKALEGVTVLEQPLTLKYIIDCTRRCKLYDYDARRWMDFSGRYTSSAHAG